VVTDVTVVVDAVGGAGSWRLRKLPCCDVLDGCRGEAPALGMVVVHVCRDSMKSHGIGVHGPTVL